MSMLAFHAPILLSAVMASPVQWAFKAEMSSEGCWVVLEASVEPGWHVYATELPSDQGPLPTLVRFTPSEGYAWAAPLVEPEPVEEYDHNFGVTVRHHSGTVEFRRLLRPIHGPAVVVGEVEYMVCNDHTCLPPVVVSFKIEVPVRASGN